MKERGTIPGPPDDGYNVLLLSIHGLHRGEDLELGRDPDTGGQVQYVVELARALSRHPKVQMVELATRLILDPRVGNSYAAPFEDLAPGARIVRIPCGPQRYLRKEALWPHLDSFADNLIRYLRGARRTPDLIHAHYADAAYVASHVAGLLDVPLVFTGHSLGRVKRQRLLDRGVKPETLESRYRISRRIEAEEIALDHASFIVASTQQEVERQYKLYDNYLPKRMFVMPPGIDSRRFFQTDAERPESRPIADQLRRFLREPDKPMILTIARPDPKKNLESLVRAYGERDSLQEIANLVIVAGNRTDIQEMEKEPRRVMNEILRLVDRYDLYGKVAYPKSHRPKDVPELYQLAAQSHGVFVNPALTEPFGLTLIEAASSGLPIIATNDGGPRDIIENCKNGILIDPLDAPKLGEAIESALGDRKRWQEWARSGGVGVRQHYTWDGHVDKYLQAVEMVTLRRTSGQGHCRGIRQRLVTMDRLVLSDIDYTVTGDREGAGRLVEILEEAGPTVGFGVATGRSLKLTLEVLEEWGIPMPELLITSVGSEIHYGPNLIQDFGWIRQIRYRWERQAVSEALRELPGLKLQLEEGQGPYKVSFFIDPKKAPGRREIVRHLRTRNIHANIILSHDMFLDALPIRASKGHAVRYFAMKWGLPFEHLLVAGDSGNDEDMLTGNTLGVVVANYSHELEVLRDQPRIYFAGGKHAWGIIEGMNHYGFLGEIRFDEPTRVIDAVSSTGK